MDYHGTIGQLLLDVLPSSVTASFSGLTDSQGVPWRDEELFIRFDGKFEVALERAWQLGYEWDVSPVSVDEWRLHVWNPGTMGTDWTVPV